MTSLKNNIDPAELQRELGQTIGEVSRAWRHEMNARLKPFGLNLSMRQVLMQLQRAPDGLMQRDLARELDIEGPTLVRLLDQLEKKEWIQRIPSSEDKRCKYSVLTNKATKQIQIIEKITLELRQKMMQDLPVSDIEATLLSMRIIKNNLRA